MDIRNSRLLRVWRSLSRIRFSAPASSTPTMRLRRTHSRASSLKEVAGALDIYTYPGEMGADICREAQ